jgi:hypothetical protein
MEKSSQIAWKIVPLRRFFPLKVVPLIEVLLYCANCDGVCGTSGQRTMCFHTGMTAGFLWDLVSPQERPATEHETLNILKEIDHHFRHQIGHLTYKHHWFLLTHPTHIYLSYPVSEIPSSLFGESNIKVPRRLFDVKIVRPIRSGNDSVISAHSVKTKLRLIRSL